MPDVCIVSGSRIDDIAASVIVRKILKTNGITSGTPYFAADPAAFLFTPHYRAWRDLELPIIFVGIPLDPVTMSYWAEIWRRFCNDKNINMPFYYDNRLSSQNTFSESPYAMVSCGESLAMAAYNMAEHLSVNADDYNSMAVKLAKIQNLYTYDEDAEKLNVISYIFPPDSIYISLSLNPNWLDKALSCAVTMQYVERQRDKIEELVKHTIRVKINDLNFVVYAGAKLQIEDTDNLCAWLLKKQDDTADVVLAFRNDAGSANKGMVIEVRTKMAEARSIVDILMDIIGKKHASGAMITRNRGRVVVYKRTQGLKGSYSTITSKYIIPAIRDKLKAYLPEGRYNDKLAYFGY